MDFKKFDLEKYYKVFIMITFAVVVLPFVVVRDPIIQIHDNLDMYLPWMKMLKESNIFFSFDANTVFLHGLSRLYFPSDLKIYNLLYYLLAPIHAYILAYTVKIILGFLSNFLFLRCIVKEDFKHNAPLVCMVSACFAILPCYPETGIPFAAVPLIFYLFHRLYEAKRWNYILLTSIFLYPWISEFSRFGFFILIVLVSFFLYDVVRNKKINFQFGVAIFLLTLGYMITEYRLFYALLFQHIPTIRKEFHYVDTFYSGIKILITGQYHFAEVMSKYILLPLSLVFLVVFNKNNVKIRKFYNFLFSALIFISVLNGLLATEAQFYIGEYIPPLAGMNLSRFYIFMPLIWYTLFYFIVVHIREQFNRNIAFLLVLAQISIIILGGATYNDVRKNLLYDRAIKNNFGFSEFYSEELFGTIKKAINYQGEWSIAVGFHPAVLTYNGIATLDGYHNYYPLSYKYEFRSIIAPALDESQEVKKYFDSWGGRAYIFNEQVKYNPIKEEFSDKISLKIDRSAMVSLGGRFIFSRAEIENISELEIECIGIYKDRASSQYTIFVYKIKDRE